MIQIICNSEMRKNTSIQISIEFTNKILLEKGFLIGQEERKRLHIRSWSRMGCVVLTKL